MEPKRIACNCRRAKFTLAKLFVFTCLLACGCGCETNPPQQASYVDGGAGREMIEGFVGVKLSESVRNCRYHHKSYGAMGGGVTWGFFEISRADLLQLLGASQMLPDASKLGQDPVARENVERAMEQSGEGIIWWKPLALEKRQYASKVLESLGPVWSRQIDICVGEIRDDLMGIYLVYHID